MKTKGEVSGRAYCYVGIVYSMYWSQFGLPNWDQPEVGGVSNEVEG